MREALTDLDRWLRAPAFGLGLAPLVAQGHLSVFPNICTTEDAIARRSVEHGTLELDILDFGSQLCYLLAPEL